MRKIMIYMTSIIGIVLVFSLNGTAQVSAENAISMSDARIDKMVEMKANYEKDSPKYLFLQKYQDVYSNVKQGVMDGMAFEAARDQFHTPSLYLDLSYLQDYTKEEIIGFKNQMLEMAAAGKKDSKDYAILEMLVSLNP